MNWKTIFPAPREERERPLIEPFERFPFHVTYRLSAVCSQRSDHRSEIGKWFHTNRKVSQFSSSALVEVFILSQTYFLRCSTGTEALQLLPSRNAESKIHAGRGGRLIAKVSNCNLPCNFAAICHLFRRTSQG